MGGMTEQRMIDLSHPIENGMITYPGLPAPVITDHWTRASTRAHYAPGTEFHIGRIDMVANTGTYLDAPFHRYEDGTDVAGLPLSSLADLPCLVARVPEQRMIDVLPLDASEVRGAAVLVHTGWSRHWGSDAYFHEHPFLTGPLASWLAEAGAALIGIDSLNIDGTQTGERPVHSTLLAAGIPIVEHLSNLETVPERGARFFAVPAPVRGFGAFPVRAFALAGPG